MKNNSNVNIQQVLSPYFTEILSLNEELKKHETMLELYGMKYKKINQDYEIKRKELDEEELELSKQFISTVESEEFFKNPNEDNKTLVEEAKKHKEIFNKRKGQALLHKKKIEVKQKELDDKVNLLSQDKKELYEVICNLILGKKDNSNGENQEEKNKMIKNNQGLIRVISSKCDKLKKVKNFEEIENNRLSKVSIPNLKIINEKGSSNNLSSLSNTRRSNQTIGNKTHHTITHRSNNSIEKKSITPNQRKKKATIEKKEQSTEKKSKKKSDDNIKNLNINELEKENNKNNHNNIKKVKKSPNRNKSTKSEHFSNKSNSCESKGSKPEYSSKQSKGKQSKPKYNPKDKPYKKPPNISIYSHNSDFSCSSIPSKINTSLPNMNHSVSPNRSITTLNSMVDNIGNTNKSFYLYRNARIEKSLRHNTEISQDDLGGEYCCYRLLRNYRNDIRNSSLEFLRNTKARSKSSCHNSSYVEDKSLVKERLETRMSNTPKIVVGGRLVSQSLIGQATNTENGVIEQ